jgi:hypothetical protein
MVLGDVSGKGMPASLMMMGLQARVQVLADEPQNLAAVINRLNKITCKNCPSNRFITFFFCVLDPATGELAYCNAGHNPPVLVRAEWNRGVPGWRRPGAGHPADRELLRISREAGAGRRAGDLQRWRHRSQQRQ